MSTSGRPDAVARAHFFDMFFFSCPSLYNDMTACGINQSASSRVREEYMSESRDGR